MSEHMIPNWSNTILELSMSRHALTGKEASAPDYSDRGLLLTSRTGMAITPLAIITSPPLSDLLPATVLSCFCPISGSDMTGKRKVKRRALRGDINFVTGNRWGTKFKDGIPGILDPITQAPWGNSASEDLYMGMLSGSVWGAIPLMWYCNYTQDINYLKTTAYPYLKEVADFWEAYLVKIDGKWIIKYTAYQEWASNDNNNTALDNAFVMELFRNMIRYSTDLNIDVEKRAIWQDIVNNMKELPKGNLGGQFVFKVCDEEMLKEGTWPGLALLCRSYQCSDFEF